MSLDLGVNPVWSPDGRELFYRGGSSITDLMVAQVETESIFSSRTPELLVSLVALAVGGGPNEARTFDLAPDGDRFIFRTPETAVQTSDEQPFNGLIFVEHWFEELTARVPVP